MIIKLFLTLNLGFMTSTLLAAETAPELPRVDHIIIVEFENIDYSKAMAQPTFKKIAAEGANLSNFYAETHPSQPNYLAMISGSMWGVTSDKNVDIDGRHIGDLLEEAGKTWKVYADDYPGNCFLGPKFGKYVRKHVPFLSFKNIQENPERCASIVEGGELSKDLLDDELPTYSLYIPNLSDDGHDTGVAYADNWLKTVFMPKLISNLPEHTLVVFTFDESSRTGGNHIYTAFYGDVVKAGSVYASRTDHYGFLRTVEALLGLPTLGKEDEKAHIISGIWQ
ncbi:MAG: hypothetical protein EOP07_12920 [Proteobacteria bacterium]|nr:MAG: hypothetical protein EOP07_12920 [Pseudomonadota bacterium]